MTLPTRRTPSAGATATLATAVTTRREEPAQGVLILGRYRLHRPLGAGAFGFVWLASDERLERDVAVKMLPRGRILSGRFEREARAAARLTHPGIVTLYEAVVDDEGAYLVSELVRGPTLAELMDAGRLSDRDVVEIGIALCDALVHAHHQGVVHRDLKPSNVLVPEQPASPAELAKLTDFGVARVVGGDTLTRTGDVIGTAAYMAPEQAEGLEAGAPADLYALALVLYEALTGVNPMAAGEASRRARRLGAHLPPLRRARRELPLELGRGIDHALRPRPRERGTVEELRGELGAALDQVGDEPGVVVGPWPTQWSRRSMDEQPVELAPPPERQAATAIEAPASITTGWPSRVLAGVVAGLLVAWVAARLLSPSPVAPAALGLVAGVAVLVLPRIGWLAAAGSLVASLAVQGHSGTALVFALAAAVPIVLMPRRATSWPLAGVAPALGALSLAGAWPVLAGQGRSAAQRAGLGAAGWLWLVLGAAMAGHALYTTLPHAITLTWSRSSGRTLDVVVPALLRPGLLAPAVVWGAAAAILPLIPRRPVALAVVLITIWSAVLASGTETFLRGFHAGVRPESGVVALGAVAAWVVALLALLVSHAIRGGGWGNTRS
jgi:serine/threonine protein kinase